MKDLKNYLVELCGEHLPSGSEGGSFVPLNLLKPLVDECGRDRAGNVIGFRGAAFPHAPKILLDAHLDEISLVITEIDRNGFLHFRSLAGFPESILPAANVMVHGRRPVQGVVSVLPNGKTIDRPKTEDMVIDVGLDAEQAERCIRIGDTAVLRQNCMDLLNDRMTGKSFDDRAGVAVILDVLNRLSKMPLSVDLYVSFSCAEEFSGFGARHAAFEIEPDEAIVLDVTFGTDPGSPAGKTFPLGSGAAIGFSPILNGPITSEMVRLAEEHQIPFCREVMTGRTGTNSDHIVAARDGVAVGLVSIPLRYMHSGVELIDLADLKAVSDLVYHYVNRGGVTHRE